MKEQLKEYRKLLTIIEMKNGFVNTRTTQETKEVATTKDYHTMDFPQHCIDGINVQPGLENDINNLPNSISIMEFGARGINFPIRTSPMTFDGTVVSMININSIDTQEYHFGKKRKPQI